MQRTILIVEDDVPLRKAVREMLTLMGYRVVEAGSGWGSRPCCRAFRLRRLTEFLRVRQRRDCQLQPAGTDSAVVGTVGSPGPAPEQLRGLRGRRRVARGPSSIRKVQRLPLRASDLRAGEPGRGGGPPPRRGGVPRADPPVRR